uniref:Uncharacterized mitochondrial protein AtMg00810-like n=1 Tax=Tanacetum cinerariifolium TaxID=118510 RepID=A0A6L2LQP6_TANCI|nr:uncharacterized mitochondrial protein AtMg00810-like [Tanacetum cinerariifolium]
MDLQDQGVIDSGCSRHMTGNMFYLTDYKEIDGGYVAFGENPKGGKITKKVVTDDYSRFTWVFFLATKDEPSGILKSFIIKIENLVDHKVKVIRCDNGTEFKNKEMNQFCEMKGILRQFSVARTPQQNKVAERRKRTLIEAARTMLADYKLPTTFWAEAVNTACYVQNRVLVVKPHNNTLYELFHGRRPTSCFMRPFRCPVTILNTKDHLGKFNGKADEGFFIRYSMNSKAFRVFNSRTMIVEENLHIRFSESTLNVVGSETDWLFDIDALKRTRSYEPIVVGTQSNGFCSTKNVVGINEDNELSFDPNVTALEDVSTFDFLRNDEDDGAVASTTIQFSPILTTRIHKYHPLDQVIRDLQSATQTRKMSKNLEEHGFVSTIQQKKTIKTFKTACLLAFYHKKNPKRIKAIRLFLAYASFKDSAVYQMDVKSAFLYGKIKEEVCVCQPPGFEDPDFLDRVYKELCNAFERLMHKKFQMSSMGELTFFLELQVKQKKDGTFISQDKYVAKILKKFRFIEVKTTSTHMETQKPLLKDEDGKEVDVHMYRSMIGSLMYLTSSRPGIIFAVCACTRYQVNPKVSQLHTVKRIFRCLKGQLKLGLWYLKDSPFDLVAYTDSDYAGVSLDRKSTTGGCQFLICRLISWQFKKQTVVANSTTEDEYVAASSCCRQVLWIQNQLLDYGISKGFSGRVTPLFQKMVIQNQSKSSEGLAMPTDPHHIPTILQPSSSQPQKTQKPRKPKRKDTQVPQPSGPTDNVADEAVHKELSDRLVPRNHGDTTTQTRVESSDNEESLGEDASKQGRRIDVIDADDEITLVNDADYEMFGVDDLGGEEVFVAGQNDNVVEEVVNAAQASTTATTKTITIKETTLAQALKALKTSKPKVKEIIFYEPSKSTTTTTTISSHQSQDKDKGIMIEEPVKPKKKDQIRLDEEAALKLQAEFDEEERLAREREC